MRNLQMKIKQLIQTLLIFSFVLVCAESATLTVTPSVNTINSVAIYEWKIIGLTGTSNSTVVLQFPSNCVFNSTAQTAIFGADGVTAYTIIIFSNSNITITLKSTDLSNSSLTFRATNIKNPPFYIIQQVNFHYSNTKTPSFVQFQNGAIQNCALTFDGVTDQRVSIAYVDFKVSNPISKNKVIFVFTYGAYATTKSLVDTTAITCAYKINANAVYSAEVVAISNSPKLNCQFNGLNLTANSTVTIRLTNVRNPPYRSNYLSNFVVTTNDGDKSYDTTSSCTYGLVTVDTYEATFTQTSYQVNSNYSSPVALTIGQMNKDFSSTIMQIVHNDITFNPISSFVLLKRSTTTNIIKLDYSTGTTGTGPVIYQNPRSDDNPITDKIQITLSSLNLIVPVSASPRNVTFKFYKTNTSYEYLNIFCTLKPIPSPLPSNSLKVEPSTYAIGELNVYKFTVFISQPLGTSARILLYLPLELNISQIGTTCSMTSNDTLLSATPTCSIFNSANNILQALLNSTTGISKLTQLILNIGGIVNPITPQKQYSFGVETHYDSNDLLSKVQTASNIASVSYIQRGMNVKIVSQAYTVNYYPSILVLEYIPGVKIPAGLVLMIKFTSNLTSLVYKNTTVNGSLVSYQNKLTTFNFNLTIANDISANSNITLSFQFRAPTKVASHIAITQIKIVQPPSITYQIKSSSLSIDVLIAAPQLFTLTPYNTTTGIITTYRLNFYTNVFHPNPFFLSIVLPVDVNKTVPSAIKCTTPCKSVINKSTASIQEIYLNISTTIDGIYSINLTNIENPRYIGETGAFVFTSLTAENGGYAILNGVYSPVITTPNLANATFDLSKPYYRMNILPVSIQASFFNTMKTGDFIRVWFDYRTYVKADNLSISCSGGITCFEQTFSTNFSLIVRVIPNNLTSPIKFSIQGLNSSSTTLYTQKFQVIVKSYYNDGADGRQMDQGKLTYNVSCSNIAAKNCRQCNTVNCTSCYSAYYLNSATGTCVTNCGSETSYQAYPGDKVCVQCKDPCKTCISITKCLTCAKTDFFLYENSSCIFGCGDGFYSERQSNGQMMCLACWSPDCLKCANGGSSNCSDCNIGYLQGGKCISDCDTSTSSYVDSKTNQCLSCNTACSGCTGPQNSQCIKCKSGHFNVSGICQLTCPTDTVGLSNGTCGCEGNCSKCQRFSTRCLACLNINYYLYNYQCLDNCPPSTYNSSNKCFDCQKGCQICTANACTKCLTGYNVYETKCYSQCNNVGPRFAAVNGQCIQCPQGCDLCDSNLICSVCLGNYTLVNQTYCKKTCQINNNCQIVSPVPDKILPVPGFVTAAVWLVVLIPLKIFFIQTLYLPYSYIFFSCVVEYVLIIASLAKMDASIKAILAQNSARLLQTITTSQTAPQSYQYAIIGVLACALALNYIQNFVFLFLYCKYMRKYIPDRQIDKISNYLVLAIGTLTNFRFTLMAYSKMFPKPSITVENQSKLTPIHYMCIVSIFTSILPLGAAGVLIYNEYPLTDLFMLGIDLLLIVVISLVFTIWMVSVKKPDSYFQSTKKYSKQENNQTMEALNEKQDSKNESKHKLRFSSNNIQNSIIQVEDIPDEADLKNIDDIVEKKAKDIKSDNQNQPLPQIPVRTTQINLQTMKVKPKGKLNQTGNAVDDVNSPQEDSGSLGQENQSKLKKSNLNDQKTLRNVGKADTSKLKKSQSQYKQTKGNQKQIEDSLQAHVGNQPNNGQQGIRNRSKESPKNFGKQRNTQKKSKTESLNLQIKNISKDTDKGVRNDQSYQLDESQQMRQPSLKPAQSDIIQRQKKIVKPATQRSSGIIPVTMKKRDSYGLFESQKAQSQVDEVDLESIIQTKMIDKTKLKPKVGSSKQNEVQHEQISPSWFNQQNQRFDFDDSSQI